MANKISKSDLVMYKRLLTLSEKGMLKAMSQYLTKRYENTIITKDYIVAIGDIPIALVAHMDTVFKTPPCEENTYFDPEKGVIWSSVGAGHDDRAGIFAIVKILQSGLRPSVILTTGEEQGGVGACALTDKYPDCPLPGLKYMIELDRRGTNDCVFYDCYCPQFVSYVESFGFCERYGSFTDISFLMSSWQIVGVNLSVGYEDEHSYSETLHINPLFDTIRKVKEMLTEEDIPTFLYDEISVGKSAWWSGAVAASQMYKCHRCKKTFTEYELFPVIGAEGQVKLYCPDCIVGKVNWCETCGEAFEISTEGQKICKLCQEDLENVQRN
jgi:hypothetical protein